MNDRSINLEEVKKNIEFAFANVQFPGDEYLLDSTCQDESEIEDFKGRNWQRWQDIPPEIIDYNYSSLPFLTPIALLFFLPAYMIYGLENFDSNVLEFTVYKLIPPVNVNGQELKLKELFLSWVIQLTSDQQRAITLFLEYVKEQYEQLHCTSNDANEALQSYWNNYEIGE